MLQALQMGTIDIYVGSTGPVGNFSPSMNILDIPFLFATSSTSTRSGRPHRQAAARRPRKNSSKGLAFWENGFRNLTNSRGPIRTPDQGKGLKLRTMENKTHMAAFKAAGISPTPMAWAEVYPALEQKVIDAQENPIAVIYSSKIYEVQKYLSLTGHVYSPAPVIFSLMKWNRIPKADQEIIQKAAMEVAAFQRKVNRDAEEAKIKEMESKGMVVVRDVDKAAWQAAMKPAMAEFEKQFGKDKIAAIVNTR
jgi:tripartite ATP-independent transporter DctP family solute receptor